MKSSRRMTRPSIIGVALLGIALTLTGCSTQESGGREAGQPESVKEVSFPDSKIGQSAEWVVEQLNGDTVATESGWKGRLAPSLTAEMAPQDLVEIINTEIRPRGPFTPTDFSAGEDNALTQLIDADGEHLQFSLLLDPKEGLISGIHFTPASS